MKQYRMIRLLGPLLCLLCGCSSTSTEDSPSGLPYYNDESFTPKWFEHGALPADFHHIPEFSLTNQLGQEVSEQVFEEKITVVDFFFTSCPGICPKLTSNMAVIQQAFQDDDYVQLVSYSVTPQYDSVSVLLEYAQHNQVQAGKWHLLTGDRAIIYSLGRNYFFAEEDLGRTKSLDDFLHTENLLLIDGNRHIRGIYNGLNKASIKQLIIDIAALKTEAFNTSRQS